MRSCQGSECRNLLKTPMKLPNLVVSSMKTNNPLPVLRAASTLSTAALCHHIVENLSTSCRKEKPRNSKTPPSIQKETPRNTFSDTPSETQKLQNSYFWGISLVFSGHVFSICCFRGVRMWGWYFGPIWGGGGVFYSVADQ